MSTMVSVSGLSVLPPVQAGDDAIVGTISDMWVDEPEQLVRYLEIELDAAHGGGKRLVPIQLAKIKSDRVKIHSVINFFQK